MSAFAGIRSIRGAQTPNNEMIRRMDEHLKRFAPDDAASYRSDAIAMAHRGLRVWPRDEAASGIADLPGVAIAWDGRIDNRKELSGLLSVAEAEAPMTSAHLVALLYTKFGIGCLARIVGEFAVAVWDTNKATLILARDYIGVRRLFYRTHPLYIAWSTHLDPLVMSTEEALTLDQEHIVSMFENNPSISTTPYREIRCILPGSYVEIDGVGRIRTYRYWSCDPRRSIRYANDQQYGEHFLSILKESISDRILGEPVVADLSGGIDSSSLVCVADVLSHERGIPKVHTFSYYDPSEPSGDERHYFRIIERHREVRGAHVSIETLDAFREEIISPLPETCFAATPKYNASSLHWSRLCEEPYLTNNSRINLSGLGGDELLGGVPYCIPELAENLASGHLGHFLRTASSWGIQLKKPMVHFLPETIALLAGRLSPNFIEPRPQLRPAWCIGGPTASREGFTNFSSWRSLSPAKASLELIRFRLAHQLTTTDPPLTGLYERTYPYLDRRLFEFLAAIPREQVIQAGRRRHLMRSALRGIVPAEVLLRKSKYFSSRRLLANFQALAPTLRKLFAEKWHTHDLLFHKALLERTLDSVLCGASESARGIYAALGVEFWVRDQLRRSRIRLP